MALIRPRRPSTCTHQAPYSVASALSRHLDGACAADDTAAPSVPAADGAPLDDSLDLTAKKREVQPTSEGIPPLEHTHTLTHSHGLYVYLGVQVWEAKEARIKSKSELGRTDGWALRSLIVKSNDDVRQEVRVPS